MEYSFVTLTNGEKIHYRDVNPESQKQETIFFIHGNFSSLKWWDDSVDALKDLGNRIIVIDQRGFGKSSYNTECRRFTDWARDILELFEIFKVKKVILNGWSFGGAISQKVAQMAPESVSKLILTCAVCHEGHFIKNSQGKTLKTEEEICKDPKVMYSLNLLKERNEEGMRQIFDLLLFQNMPNYPEERKKLFALDPFDQRCYSHLLEALANSDIDVNKIKAKTLLIHGQEDKVLLPQTIFNTAEKLGKLQLWEGLGHMIPVEAPQKYHNTVRAFIQSQ